jgi:hypothetical protein
MSNRSRITLLFALLLAGTVAGCSSSSSSSDVEGGADGGSSSTDAGHEGSTDAGPDGNTDGGTTAPEVTTATITFDGATTTVTPNVRRGMTFVQPIQRDANLTWGTPLQFSCAPAASVSEGGRSILIDRNISIYGDVVGNCAKNPAQIDGAEDNIGRIIFNACSGKSQCAFDPSEAMTTYLGECQPQNLHMNVQYKCNALDPAPLFTFDTATPNIALQALEGLGTATCAERAALFYIDNQRATPVAEEPCAISITEKTDRSIKGTVTATFDINGRKSLSISFEHNRNRLRARAGVHLGKDVCMATSVTHTVREAEGETYDDFTTGSFQCQVNASTVLKPLTFTRRRASATSSLSQELTCGAGRLNISDDSGKSTVSGECGAVFFPTETDQVIRAVAQRVSMCENGSSCDASAVVAYLSFGFGDALAAEPQ